MCTPAASCRTGTKRMSCAASWASSGSISAHGNPNTNFTPSLARQRARSSPPVMVLMMSSCRTGFFVYVPAQRACPHARAAADWNLLRALTSVLSLPTPPWSVSDLDRCCRFHAFAGLIHPGHIFLLLGLGFNQVQDLPCHRTGTTDDSNMSRSVVANLGDVGVDLNQLGVLVD